MLQTYCITQTTLQETRSGLHESAKSSFEYLPHAFLFSDIQNTNQVC